MRLFPLARRIVFLGRGNVDGVMDPAMPGRRNTARLGIAVINNPAALEAERGVDLAAFGAVVAVALLVLADQFAEARGPQLRAEGLAVPPSEHFEEKLLHPG